MSRKKYYPEHCITNIGWFADHVFSGWWVIINGKSYHPKFALNLPIGFILDQIEKQQVFEAANITSSEGCK